MKNQMNKFVIDENLLSSNKKSSDTFLHNDSGFIKAPFCRGWWGFGLAISILILFTTSVKAQDATVAELKVKTSAVCGMCKDAIEETLSYEKGVKRSSLDLESKIVTVTYNPKKTTPENIRLAISNAGYDADEIPANPKAYKKLSDCCKKSSVCPGK